MKPEISVIMSTFNAQNYLVDAIQSMLNEEFSDFEFIGTQRQVFSTLPRLLIPLLVASPCDIMIFQQEMCQLTTHFTTV